jgi:hypothetical protein
METQVIKAVFDIRLQGHSFKEVAQMLNAEATPSLGAPIEAAGESPLDPENGAKDGTK